MPKNLIRKEEIMIKFILIITIAVGIIALSFIGLRKIQTYFDKTYEKHK